MKYGWSNQIEEKDGFYRKTYTAFPSGSLTRSLYDAVHDREFRFQSARDRRRNEVEGLKALDSIDVDVPEILDSGTTEEGKPYLDLVKAGGENFLDLVREEELESVYENARDCGEEMRRIHDSGYALYDPAIHNMKVDDGITFLDLEYFLDEPEDHHFVRDVEQVLLYPATLEGERYSAFRSGFRDGYGSDEVSDIRVGMRGMAVRLRRGDFSGAANALENSSGLSEQPLKNSEFLSSL